MTTPAKSLLTRLNHLTNELGWPRLKRHRHHGPNQIITWFVSGVAAAGRLDCFLQINECPIGQQKQYSAAVYAPRFRLCSGWHTFLLTEPLPPIVVTRLASWLAASHFHTAAGRRAYRNAHPETVGYVDKNQASGSTVSNRRCRSRFPARGSEPITPAEPAARIAVALTLKTSLHARPLPLSLLNRAYSLTPTA